jgi:acyl-CoA synthetase (NDP forming)
MIEEVRGSRLLRGVRGEPPADIEGIVEALLGLSRLLVECPEVAEIDVNPLLVFERGVAAVDARAIVRAAGREARKLDETGLFRYNRRTHLSDIS